MVIVMFGHKSIPSRNGGVERVVEELSTRMALRGHRVICYNRGKARVREWQAVQLRGTWKLGRKGWSAVSASFFAAVLAALGPGDVVHIHAEGPAFWCWIPKLFGKRTIVTIHGLDWQRAKWAGSFGRAFLRAGERLAARFADEMLVLSGHMASYFLKTYGRETTFLPNGMEQPCFRHADRIRQQFGLEKDGYFLFLGRLVPEKGIHYLIEAFRNVRTEKKLVIAGSPSDTQAYWTQLRELAAGDVRICFTGFADGTVREELLSNAYVYVLPTDLEGMPLSLLEAMAYGNCCVTSDIPECTEVMGDSALTFPRGDVSVLRNCLQLLCDSPAVVGNYREKTRKISREDFDWDTITDRTLRLYHENSADQ